VLASYDKVDYIKISPTRRLPTWAATNTRRALRSLKAIAYHRGRRREADTPDDIKPGASAGHLVVEEFLPAHDDDDKDFVAN